MKNNVFISYSSEDLDYAKSLAEKLRTSGIEVWLDKKEITWGDPIFDAYEKALKSASAIIIIFSKNYSKSPWTALERGAAHALNKEIFIIKLDDTYDIPPDIAAIHSLNAKNMDPNKVVQRIQEALEK